MKRPPKIDKPIPTPFVADLRPRQALETELDWFFNRAESDIACLGQRAYEHTAEDAAEASHRHRRIRSWLKAIPDSDAGVLQAAYELRPWPIELYDQLGRLTGVFVRLACALDTWPADRAAQQVVEMARADWLVSSGDMRSGDPAFMTLRRAAESRFARAHHAYSVVRSAARSRGSS
jgi:hypothetical protein